MAVAPGRVFSGWSAAGVEQGGLRKQDKRVLGRRAVPGLLLGSRQLLESAAHVHRAGARTQWILPGHGSAERPIDLEDAGAVAKTFELGVVSGRKLVAADFQDLPRREVKK